MNSLITVSELNLWRIDCDQKQQQVALVPTMGALHEGHLSLVQEARKHCDKVVVSIFVNPTQFGPNEDFSKYPRTLKEDLLLLNQIGVDAVFTPLAQEIYPLNFATYIVNDQQADILCGAIRPAHFKGVLTVVFKLLQMVRPKLACFGMKDYQQLHLIKQMCRDLLVPVTIMPCPIVREADGLAMSSRNRYLSKEQREVAALIYRELQASKDALAAGTLAVENLAKHFEQSFATALTLEYAELRDRETLQESKSFQKGSHVLLVAARLGTTRLIDNIEC